MNFQQAEKLLKPTGVLLKAVIGKGSGSVVYSGTDTTWNQEVAVKIASTTFSSIHKPDRELFLLRKLNHPHIVQLFFGFVSDSYAILVIEKMQGGTLLEYLQNHLARKDTFGCWAYQLICAVNYLHRNAYAHRDIKLENILISGNHKLVKLADFGFAAKNSSGKLSRKFIGSKAYASAEILLNEPHSVFASDVFALGVVFFATVNGFFPFSEADDLKESVKKRQEPNLQWDDNRSFSKETRRTVTDMLAFCQALRPTAAQLMRSKLFSVGKALYELDAKLNANGSEGGTSRTL